MAWVSIMLQECAGIGTSSIILKFHANSMARNLWWIPENLTPDIRWLVNWGSLHFNGLSDWFSFNYSEFIAPFWKVGVSVYICMVFWRYSHSDLRGLCCRGHWRNHGNRMLLSFVRITFLGTDSSEHTQCAQSSLHAQYRQGIKPVLGHPSTLIKPAPCILIFTPQDAICKDHIILLWPSIRGQIKWPWPYSSIAYI